MARSPWSTAPHIRFLFVGSRLRYPASFSAVLTVRRLAVHFGPCDQVPGGLPPPDYRPCRAYQKKNPTGRNPWGPRGSPESPWGGIFKCIPLSSRLSTRVPGRTGAVGPNKNPTGRNPWGPGEPRKAARGGEEKSTRDELWMSRRSAPRSPDPRPLALLYPVPSITRSWKCSCARLSEENLVGDEGRPHGESGHAAPHPATAALHLRKGLAP